MKHITLRSNVLRAALILLMLNLVRVSFAQPLSLSWMPGSIAGVSGFDMHGLKRPALSITGFDNEQPGYNPDYGLGLKQILELRFNDHDPLVEPVFDRIIEVAHQNQVDPFSIPDLTARRIQLEENTAILQSRAFEALVSFILEQNGYDAGDLGASGLRSHVEALAALMEALVTPAGGVLIGPIRPTDGALVIDDWVKYSRSITNVARALDLYLALENAYVQAGVDVSQLLLIPQRFPQRIQIFQEYGTALLFVDMVLGLRAIDQYSGDINLPPALTELVLRRLSHVPEGDRVTEEVEPGNWAMKQRVAIGYGSLVMEAIPGSEEAALLSELLPKAIRSVQVVGEQNKDRLRHWNFMTYGGKRFWAESPYYLDFALEQVLPFWHTVRANGLLGNISDPFHSAWFTNPLDWHADLVTPDGRIAPIDDGNKSPVRYAGLMRWDARYGDRSTGRKYAWIDNLLGGPAFRESTLLVELAIPRTDQEQSPADRIGNFDTRIKRNESEQQLVLRNNASNGLHYLVLNGEHGAAVDRGEGHEQPDQLQLLYYKDDLSYLLDSGYDQGATVANSSWNHYYDHNVMTVGEGEGGLLPPVLSLLEVRKASETWFMGEVDELNFKSYGSAVDVLHGKQVLNVDPALNDRPNQGIAPLNLEDLMLKRRPYYRAEYNRDVLHIGGENPYLIDVNMARHQTPPAECESNHFRMQYHVNSDQVVMPDGYLPSKDGFFHWEQIGDEDGVYLHAFPMSVEFDIGVSNRLIEPDFVMERERSSETEGGPGGKERKEIKKLVLQDLGRCVPFWSVATVFQAGTFSSATGSRPELLWEYDTSNEKQGWIWPRGNSVYDVFIARSIDALKSPVAVSPSQIDVQFPDIVLEMPNGVPYGFARLEQTDGQWYINPAYQVELVVSHGVNESMVSGKMNSVNEGEDLVVSEVYPNPFNPTTTFTLRLRKAQEVTVGVYDMLGRRRATLYQGSMAADRVFRFDIDASTWESGVYMVRIEGEQFVDNRRIVLIK